MTRTVLVTGGLGYLGGRICRHLGATDDWDLRLTTRRSHEMLPAWAKGADVRFFDFSDHGNFDELCRGVDAIVHLAAFNAQQCAENPEAAERVNVGGTQYIVAAAERARIGRFVYASTAHVYGAPLIGSLDETAPPRPAHPYATTHLAAEDIVLAAAGTTGIVLRISNGIGAPADANVNCWMLVANDLCRQAATRSELILHGDGEGVRDFVALGDVAAAIGHVLGLPEADLGERLFNLGGDNSVSVYELARRVAERSKVLFGNDLSIVRKDPGPAAARRVLGYRIDRLLRTGFRLHGDLDTEIDATLRLCHEAFASEKPEL